MEKILEDIKECIIIGKIDAVSPFPPHLKGQPGAGEFTCEALNSGINPSDIMSRALVPGMHVVGELFSENKIYVPQMLLSAKAMNVAMEYLKPYFKSGDVKRRGISILGTVMGDLHDIGKNLCGIMVEGAGWEVVDLGVDVTPEKFAVSLQEYPEAVIGMSALLTTTMSNMRGVIEKIKAISPSTRIIVGGAPVSAGYASSIGADAYGKDPQEAVRWLNSIYD